MRPEFGLKLPECKASIVSGTVRSCIQSATSESRTRGGDLRQMIRPRRRLAEAGRMMDRHEGEGGGRRCTRSL